MWADNGGSIDWWYDNRTTGWHWLQKFRQRFRTAVWINPDPPRYWSHPTVKAIGDLFPMFPLTLDGLDDAVKALKKDRPAPLRSA